MPGICIHEFFWPLRGADGHYYQVCRLCGAQCEYDWKNMRRVAVDPEAASANSADIQPQTQLKNLPRLRLLVELEPAHRVFLRNLSDTLRSIPPRAHECRSLSFWREVLFDSGLPWRRFGQSLLGHAVVLALVLTFSHSGTLDQPLRRSPFENTHLTYYKPDGSYPALRGNPAPVQRASQKQIDSARRGSIRVAPERAQAALKAPDIKLKGPARPNMAASNPVLPAMPLASTGSSRFSGPSSPTAIVAPPPEVSQGTSRRLGLLQASGVAPAPQVGVESSRRAVTVPGAAVVGPPPVLQASISRVGEVGDINIGPAAVVVVAPAPRLPVGEQRTISGSLQSGLGGLAGLAVPPPPKVSGSGTLASGRAGLLSGAGSGVVPPPPSVQAIENADNPAGAGRGGSLSGSSLSSSGVQVVPPPPSLGGAGGSDAAQRAGLFSGVGSGEGLQAVPPAPSVGEGGGGNSGQGGRQMTMANAPALAPAPPITDNPRQRPAAVREPPTQEMPLRLIGLAMALPSSSYFSNYEVYIAERRLRKNLTELVKLVYVYLPYQRRLSEYGVDNSKVYKLLVSRDRTCDESLMQMTWPETDPHPDAHNAADAPGLSAADKNGMLPCYRTTADDYRKAIARR